MSVHVNSSNVRVSNAEPDGNGVVTIVNQPIVRLKRTVKFSDLTDATNGEAQSINLGTLPADAIVVASDLKLVTQFTGGSASAVKLDLGTSGDTTSIVNQFDVFGATAGGKRYAPAYAHLTAHGDHAVGAYSGAVLLAQFTPDGAHHLSALTAGEVEVNVWYFVDLPA